MAMTVAEYKAGQASIREMWKGYPGMVETLLDQLALEYEAANRAKSPRGDYQMATTRGKEEPEEPKQEKATRAARTAISGHPEGAVRRIVLWLLLFVGIGLGQIWLVIGAAALLCMTDSYL